jgi:arabinofuranosyltransferase
MLRATPSSRNSFFSIAALLVPLVLIVAGWALWKLGYYGDVLPNTFYAKTGAGVSSTRGAYYVYMFLLSNLLIPFVVIGAVALPTIIRERKHSILTLLTLVLLWCAYIIRVGGDPLAFRFLVPVLPALFVCLGWLITCFTTQRNLRIALVALVLLGSIHHAVTYGESTKQIGIAGVRQLGKWVSVWADMGMRLGTLFGSESDVTIATSAAGALPYYSGLTTIDMYGLNDKWVARNGVVVGNRPGHQRYATPEYLLEREVNIVIAHPRPLDEPSRPTRTYSVEDIAGDYLPSLEDAGILPEGACVIDIPLGDGALLPVLYMCPSPAVDLIIRQQGLTVHPIAAG